MQKINFKYYAGIGSRETPHTVGLVMMQIAKFLEEQSYILRSGGANGADSFFEDGVINVDNKNIYLPEQGFNKSTSNLFGVCNKALEIASSIHPAWQKCKPYARLLHGRNVYQILGKDLLTPSKFVLCWTENGESRGGTRTAIKLAEQYNIPILNFGAVKSGKYMDAFENFYMFME